MTAILFPVYVVLYLLAFWYCYILIMGLYRAHLMGRLTGLAKWCAYPAVIIGWLMDWLANWVIASVVFAQPPQRWNELVTDRLTRYSQGPEGRNRTLAVWICTNLLDYFDPTGKHCNA